MRRKTGKRNSAAVLRRYLGVVIAGSILAGCGVTQKPESSIPETAGPAGSTGYEDGYEAYEVSYEVEPETFTLTLYDGDQPVTASEPGEKRRVENLVREGEKTTWNYPDEAVTVSMEPEGDHLLVTITSQSENDHDFIWPRISGDTYYLPFGEGKRIPGEDEVWNRYLSGQEFNVTEQLSMPFWAAAKGDHAVMYLMENPIRNSLVFQEGGSTAFQLVHQYLEIDDQKENTFRVYLTGNDPVEAAKRYRQYVKDQGNFVTLEQKAKENPDVRKLYGAPHIYLWGENLIAPTDINWPEFRKALNEGRFDFLLRFTAETESGAEIKTVLEEIKTQDYVADYQKYVLCRFLSEVVKMPSFSGEVNEESHETGQLEAGKQALAGHLPEVFAPADTWMNGETVTLLKDLKASGIDHAWIGLNSWEQAYGKPELAQLAVENGYLIAPYDSYHSIHEPGKEQWITAKFEDETLYEQAAVTRKNGEKEAGFQQVGRKLNPVLSLPSVKQRVESILRNKGADFNSWFIDCDATGEIYDDYSPDHVTTKQQDLQARLERMKMIRDQYGMVIGSEGGHDFAASMIAFAHGIELKSFSWMDEDMKSNRDSEYYIGKYYSPSGGVAEHFSRQIPVKEEYKIIFTDPKYDVPLYKMVYNDSIITTYHWDWSTFKIKEEVNDRMVREVLYNVPPLYHLDGQEWEKYREAVTAHHVVWSPFSKQAVLREMTGFEYLKNDGSVQKCSYGDDLWAAANFGDSPFLYEDREIPPHSVMMMSDGGITIYTPDAQER